MNLLDCLKSKVGLFNLYNLSSYQASHQHSKSHINAVTSCNILAISHFSVGFDRVKIKGLWFNQSKRFNKLPNPIHKTECTKQNLLYEKFSLGTKPNILNQIYWTKNIKPRLSARVYSTVDRTILTNFAIFDRTVSVINVIFIIIIQADGLTFF